MSRSKKIDTERAALAGTFLHTTHTEIAHYLRHQGKIILPSISNAVNVIIIPDTITRDAIIRDNKSVHHAVQANKKSKSNEHALKIIHLSDYCQRHMLPDTPGMIPLSSMTHKQRSAIMDEKRVERNIMEDEEEEEEEEEEDQRGFGENEEDEDGDDGEDEENEDDDEEEDDAHVYDEHKYGGGEEQRSHQTRPTTRQPIDRTEDVEDNEDEYDEEDEQENKYDNIKLHPDYRYSADSVAAKMKEFENTGRKLLCYVVGDSASVCDRISDILIKSRIPVVRRRQDATVILLADKCTSSQQEHLGQDLLICPAILFLKERFGHVDFPKVPYWVCSPQGQCRDTPLELHQQQSQQQQLPQQQPQQKQTLRQSQQQQQTPRQSQQQSLPASNRKKDTPRPDFQVQLPPPPAASTQQQPSDAGKGELNVVITTSQCGFPDERFKHQWVDSTTVFKADVTDPTNGKRYTIIFVTQDIAEARAQLYVAAILRRKLLEYLENPVATAPASSNVDIKTRLYNGLQYCKVLFTKELARPKDNPTLPYLPCDFTILLIAKDPKDKSIWCRCGVNLIPRAQNKASIPAVEGKDVPMSERVKEGHGIFLSKTVTGEFNMPDARVIVITNQSFRDLKMEFTTGSAWPIKAKEEAQLYYKNNKLEDKTSAIPFCLMVEQQIQ